MYDNNEIYAKLIIKLIIQLKNYQYSANSMTFKGCVHPVLLIYLHLYCTKDHLWL